MKASTVPPGGKTTAVALVVAAFGVVLQMLGGADYPAVPPVLFILLAPAALVVFGRWWWTPLPVVLAGLFLTFGTFASGESRRLTDSILLDQTGLWLQLLAVVLATIAAVGMTVRSYRAGEVGGFVREIRKVLAKRTAQVLGIFFFAIGVVGFVAAQQDFGMYHNLLHFLTGFVALAVGFFGTLRHARIVCVAFGVVYLALGGLGLALGAPGTRAWDTGLFTVSVGDHVFHSLIGVVFLGGVLFTERGESPRETN